ncbi:hypothetical protein B1808_10590 [Pseudofulvimonas gallinarii]|jgi:hypothetical protein|nr:hypothetical protein [Pseudofulvimonas gallinarii]THD12948.1 hypothetical protein B1808_10590 [Pseudofulvimonas gallinarii]
MDGRNKENTMDLTFDTRGIETLKGDTAETPRPHSLQLALRRMGFRPMPDRQPQPGWPRIWRARRAEDAMADWQPL